MKPVSRHMSPSRGLMRVESRKFIGADSSSPLESLGDGMYRNLENYEVFQDRLDTRRGTALIGLSVTGTVIQRVCWETTLGDFMICHMDDGSFKYSLIDADSWSAISGFNRSAGCSIVPAGDRICVFSIQGNAVLSLSGSTIVWRRLGMPAPVIDTWNTTSGGVLSGGYAYAVEFVKKVGTVVENSSSPNRVQLAGNICIAQPFQEKVNIVVSATAQDGTAISTVDYTHVRLWRSMELKGSVGIKSELYLVKEMTAAQFTTASRIMQDNTSDSDLDDTTLVTADEIDLFPLPASNIGAIAANRMFVGASASYPDRSRLFYGGLPRTARAELYAPIQHEIPCNPGEGQDITGLVWFSGDLIVLKGGKTGRVAGGDVSSPYSEIDANIGVPEGVEFCVASGVGLFSLVQDGRFMVLSSDLRWSQFVGGMDIGTPLTAIVGAGRMQAIYHRGNLFANFGDGKIYVLWLANGCGWSRLSFHLNVLHIFRYSDNQKLGFLDDAGTGYEFDMAGVDPDDGVFGPMVATGASSLLLQAGDGFMELSQVTVLANLAEMIVLKLTVQDVAWTIASSPALPIPSAVGFRDYQWYPGQGDAGFKKPTGRTMCFEWGSAGKHSIREWIMQGFIQTGSLPIGWDPTVQPGLEAGTGMIAWLTRPNMLLDKVTGSYMEELT